MTIYYVDSAAGSNTSPYDTWAKAATTLATIASIDAAGDTIYVASTHAESTAGAVSLSWAGTSTSPTRIICADKTSGAPPATIATGASVTTTGGSTNTISINATGGAVYSYGIDWISSATVGANITVGNGTYLEKGSLRNSSSAATFFVSSSSFWRNVDVKFGGTGQGVAGSSGWIWSGGSMLSGGSTPTALLSTPTGLVENIDLSNAATTMHFATNTGTSLPFKVRKCKMPGSWTGSLDNSTTGFTSVLELINCGNAGNNTVYHRQTHYGDITQETTLVRTGGSNDGTTPLSWKFVSLAASGVFPIGALVSGEMEVWNNVAGSQITVTMQLLHDNATGLKDNEAWIEVRYSKDSGDPLGGLATSAPDVLNSGTTLSTGIGTSNWTTTGMSNPNSQQISVSFTPQIKGPIYVTVWLCKAAYTAYFDRKIALS